MAVVSCKLLWTGRGGKDTFEHHRTYTREYEVITDDAADDEAVVGNHPDIPVRGTEADFDDEAFVVGVDCQQSDDSPFHWRVYVEFDTEPPYPQTTDIDGNPQNPDNVEYQDNPLAEPAAWKITTQDSEEPAIQGRKVNAAGEIEPGEVAPWLTNTSYPAGSKVTQVGNIYVQTAFKGVSGPTGPTGEGAAIADNPTAWAPGTPYNLNDVVKNGNNVYRCSTAGTSAGAGGPTGGGTGEVDGTAAWDFIGHPAVWAFLGAAADLLNDPNSDIFRAIVNSAGHPFDPPAMVEVSRVVLSVTQNMAFASIAYIMTLKNACNVIPWRGIPARCAKILKVEHDGGKYKNGIAYVTTTWEIGLDPDTWDLRILDAGYQGYQDRTPEAGGAQVKKLVAFEDIKGNLVTEPVPMDGAGHRLAAQAEPVFLRFVPRQIKLIDFNSVLPF